MSSRRRIVSAARGPCNATEQGAPVLEPIGPALVGDGAVSQGDQLPKALGSGRRSVQHNQNKMMQNWELRGAGHNWMNVRAGDAASLSIAVVIVRSS